jgi:hypothetical protein
MAGMFIDPNDLVEVSDEKGNSIWIKARMDAGTQAAVLDEASIRGARGDKPDPEDTQIGRIGSYKLALLICNIMRWEGPDFTDQKHRPIPCNRFNIRRLDLNQPLIQQVRERIGELNVEEESPDPNSQEASGSTGAGG